MIWQIALGLLPAWLLGSIAVATWIYRWPVHAEPVNIPTLTEHAQTESSISTNSVQAYSCIWTRSLRQQLIKPKTPPPAKTTVQRRKVNLVLVGTAMEGNDSYAFLKTKTGAIKAIRIGEAVASYLLAAIHSDRVCLDRDGVLTYLKLPETTRRLIPIVQSSNAAIRQAKRPIKRDLGQTAVTATQSERTISIRLQKYSTEQFFRDVRLVPCIRASGQQVGFRLDSIASDSSLIAAGLADGDVIVSVDGHELTQLTDMDRLCASLEDGKAHNWFIRRNSLGLMVDIIQ